MSKEPVPFEILVPNDSMLMRVNALLHLGGLICFIFSFSTLRIPWHKGTWLYLFAVVSCIGHTHQVLIRPAVEVCVLATDDAIACIARLALTAVHGVAVMAQVVALGILVAVVCPICAGVPWIAHLREQHPNAITECSKVPRYHRVQIPPILKQTEVPLGERWYASIPLHSLWVYAGYWQMLFYNEFSWNCSACKTRHMLAAQVKPLRLYIQWPLCLSGVWSRTALIYSGLLFHYTCLLAIACSTPRPKGCEPVNRGGQGRQL